LTDWQEINDLRRNPQAVRALAKRLLKLTYADWREEQTRFLKDMAREKEEVTTRQAEYLIHLRDQTELFSTAGGFSVASLVEDCWSHRLPDRYRGLSDNNCEFVESIRGKTVLTRAQLRRLFFCCRELGFDRAIHRHRGVSVPP
jgi:hypothetical protein